jgi:hypothetical protein
VTGLAVAFVASLLITGGFLAALKLCEQGSTTVPRLADLGPGAFAWTFLLISSTCRANPMRGEPPIESL